MIHFLSDLHLSQGAPGATRLFLDSLEGPARAASQVLILGDLFDAWPGDDSIDDPDDTFNQKIVEALRALTDHGTSLSVQRGNRDFLLSDGFSQRSGACILPDPYVLSLPAWQFVLSHGDALCTDDTAYQDFRRQVRSPAWQKEFLSQPLEKRKALAVAMRQQSEASKREKAAQTMDVNPAATDDFLRAHGYATMIHGHTHRPARHDHIVDGIHVERWVLSDWKETRGEYLAWDGQEITRHALG